MQNKKKQTFPRVGQHFYKTQQPENHTQYLDAFLGVSTKIWFTQSFFAQNQLHAKDKYKTHPRGPDIGQADFVMDFGSKRRRYPCSLYASRSLLVSANFEPEAYIYTYTDVSCLRMCLPSLGWILTCVFSTWNRFSYPSTSSTSSIRADSSILHHGSFWSAPLHVEVVSEFGTAR